MAKKSKRGSEERSGAGSFTVLFTALSTILLALFITMNANSTRDELRVREVWGAIQANFSVLEGGVRFTPGKEYMPPGAPVVMSSAEDWTDSVLFADMMGFFRDQAKGDGVTTHFDRDELVISLSSDVLFEAGTDRLRSGAEPLLRVIGHVVRRTLNPVEIGGRAADARPPAANWDLSGSRALAVAEWMMKKGRVDAGRLHAVAFGPRPMTVGKGAPPLRAADQRVSIRFRNKRDSRLMPFSGVLNFRGFLFKVRSLMGEK